MVDHYFPRLQGVFGVPVGDRLDAAAIRSAIADHVAEFEQLDWKQDHYRQDEHGRAEISKDVCALANYQGGVIVVGVEERDGSAERESPVELSEGAEQRIRHVLASWTSPMPLVDVFHVPADQPGTGFMVIVVPPSQDAPHAYAKPGDSRLSYPMRHGRDTRHMSESEVAAAYTQRLERTGRRRGRLDEVMRQGTQRLDMAAGNPWLTLALVPTNPGRLELDYPFARVLPDWLREVCETTIRGLEPPYRLNDWAIDVGRVAVGERPYGGAGFQGYCFDLHTDGAAFCAAELRQQRVEGHEYDRATDEWLVDEIATLVRVGCRHALDHCATWGRALALLTIHARPLPTEPGAFEVPFAIGRHRNGDFRAPLGQPRRDVPSAPVVIDLSAITDAPELLSAVRQVATPLFQAFGFAEVPQITTDGQLRISCYERNYHLGVKDWAERHGVTISGDLSAVS